MLQKEKSKKIAILKYGLSVPLFLLAMILSSSTVSKNETIKSFAKAIEPKLAVSDIILPEKVVERKIASVKDKTKLKQKVDTLKAKFPEGQQAFSKFLAKNLRYPKQAKDAQIQGRVIVSFSVDVEGSLSDIKVLKGIGGGCDEEVIRVLKLSPKWEPALNNGKKVKVQQTLPVNFRADVGGSMKGNDIDGEIVITAYLTALSEVSVDGDKQAKKDSPVFLNVETLPTFPGGLEEFGRFLGKNIQYPEEARKNNTQGRVYCQFVVEVDGSLSSIKVVRGIGSGCDEEAVRVLAISPKWNPGIQNGRIVRVSYTIPIFFQMTASPPNKFLPPPPPGEKSPSALALYIIDGKEYEGSKTDLTTILKPTDIESIHVLKDEAAVKAYGDKGKNGVIIVKTKKKN
jgi:TonB family protein